MDAQGVGASLTMLFAAGLQGPNIAVLSAATLKDACNMPQRKLVLEMLSEESTACQERSIVQSRKFSERLEKFLIAYHNPGPEMAEIIDHMI